MDIINEAVLTSLRENTKKLLDTYKDFGLNKSPKNISEDISGLLGLPSNVTSKVRLHQRWTMNLIFGIMVKQLKLRPRRD